MKIKNLILISALMLIFTSCKYEEGPAVSLRSKEERLCNEWKIDKKLTNGVENTLTEAELQTIVEFKKGGEYSITVPILGVYVVFSGTWEFYDNKEKIIITYEANVLGTNVMQKDTSKILRLMEKELWLEGKDSTDIVEIHYIPY
ncbi:MAG: hypothetical protein PWQ43_133 [Rikenellaceae bacterium]|nr:hypothetical protein [Rikenellaceae bacterium]MDN5355191.1 hypothetical protein [Rikenellaceae bacterium]